MHMKTSPKRLLLASALLAAGSLSAQISNFSDTFSVDPGGNNPFTPSAGGIFTPFLANSGDSNNASDDFGTVDGASGATFVDITGDGVGDGAIAFNFGSNTSGADLSISIDLTGTIVEGEQYAGSAFVSNNTGSFSNASFQLVRGDGTVLADSGIEILRPAAPNNALGGTSTATNQGIVELSVVYTALAADAGETLQLRITENVEDGFRDIIVDAVSFTVTAAVPEPSTYALLSGLLGLSFVMIRRRK